MTMSRLKRLFTSACLVFTVLIFVAEIAHAQDETLPKGVGLYQFGYRSFAAQTDKFDQNGNKVSLGQPFNQEFSGANLQRGAGGAELKRLADELARFDSNSNTDQSLLNQLNLGRMEGQVKANIDAKVLALAFGATNRWTLFTGIPFVKASVDTDISFTPGANGAPLIKQRLGELAFDELKSGLDQAAAINANTIKQSIEAKGYAPIEHWEYSGLGDIQAGAVWGLKSRLARGLGSIFSYRMTTNIPTGYEEQPDILTDVDIGTGSFGFKNELTEKVILFQTVWVGAAGRYGYNFSTTKTKRLPEAEEGVVSQDRTTKVTFLPGADMGADGMLGLALGVIKARYTFGVTNHERDRYTGTLVGNYDKLSEGSDSYQSFHDASLILQTADLFRMKRFPVPFILELNAHVPFEARNAMDDRYYMLSISSFFSTPMAKSAK
jgi:hypothetical protein